MFKFVVGALAVAWGVAVAVLDQPAEVAGRHTHRLCTALLIGCAAVTVTGAAVALMQD